MSVREMQYGIKKLETYTTTDGKVFDEYDAATEHQQEIFRDGVNLIVQTYPPDSFGQTVKLPESFKQIIGFGPGGPFFLLPHQLSIERIYSLLVDFPEVKVLGLDANNQPLEIITVAKRPVPQDQITEEK